LARRFFFGADVAARVSLADRLTMEQAELCG
jgi:hypothetical protein